MISGAKFGENLFIYMHMCSNNYGLNLASKMNIACLIEFYGSLHFKIRLPLGATFSSKQNPPKYRQNLQMAAKNSKMAAI